jgi:tol-pal system-associated acyl-CoA thioesterase
MPATQTAGLENREHPAVSGDFSLPLRVYIEDTDAGGIVYYVNYLKYLERARTEFMRSLGFGREVIFNAERMFVVQDVSLRYLEPGRLDDELVATAGLAELGGAWMQFRQSVKRGDTLLTHGDIRIVCVRCGTLKPARIPREMREALRPLISGTENVH